MEELKYLAEQIDNGLYGRDILGVKLCYNNKIPTYEIICSNIKSHDNFNKINNDLKKKFETNYDYNIKIVYVKQKNISNVKY